MKLEISYSSPPFLFVLYFPCHLIAAAAQKPTRENAYINEIDIMISLKFRVCSFGKAGCAEGETRIDVYTFAYKRRLFNGEGLLNLL
jgi:hypothetical protein